MQRGKKPHKVRFLLTGLQTMRYRVIKGAPPCKGHTCLSVTQKSHLLSFRAFLKIQLRSISESLAQVGLAEGHLGSSALFLVPRIVEVPVTTGGLQKPTLGSALSRDSGISEDRLSPSLHKPQPPFSKS